MGGGGEGGGSFSTYLAKPFDLDFVQHNTF
jgi:hypothetical protein